MDLFQALKQAERQLADLPPPPFMGCSIMLPADKALSFRVDGRAYVAAHPRFWSRVPRGEGFHNPLTSIEILDLDESPLHRQVFFDALARALDPDRQRE